MGRARCERARAGLWPRHSCRGGRRLLTSRHARHPVISTGPSLRGRADAARTHWRRQVVQHGRVFATVEGSPRHFESTLLQAPRSEAIAEMTSTWVPEVTAAGRLRWPLRGLLRAGTPPGRPPHPCGYGGPAVSVEVGAAPGAMRCGGARYGRPGVPGVQPVTSSDLDVKAPLGYIDAGAQGTGG